MAGAYAGATLVSAYRRAVDHRQSEDRVRRCRSTWATSPTATWSDIGLAHVFMPDWRVSPFVTLGTGIERVEPKATLVQPVDRNDQIGYSAAALRIYLTRRFFLRG